MFTSSRRFAAAATAAFLLSTAAQVIVGSSAVAAEPVATTLPASADTYVAKSSPTTAYGSATALKVTSANNRAFLRFPTSGTVPAGYTVRTATLRVYVSKLASASGTYEVRPQSESWSEATTTWNNQPAWSSTVLATSGTPVAGTWLSVALPASSVAATGDTSLALRYTASSVSTTVASRESANKPQLVIEIVPTSASHVALTPTGDTYTSSASPNTNYGTSATLMATSTHQRAYLRYATTGVVPSGQRVARVTLRMYVTRLSVTSGGFAVHPSSATWQESTTTWNTAPPWSSTVLGTSPTPVAGRWVSVPLPTTTVDAAADTSLALRYTAGYSNATFASRESANRPYLLLELEPATTAPVILAAGDIACDPVTTVTSTNCKHGPVSDVLLAQQPAAVLTLGDNQYSDGQYDKFLASFDPTWGRVKKLIRPAAGNHEYNDPAGGAKGHFDYFNGVGVSNGPAGARGKGYYSFDVGSWHFIALNSECSKVGGCGAGSPQHTWLMNDLAAHPTKCTVAYWHRPRFASGSGGHVGTTTMGRIWNDLVTNGVDVVLVGHNHNVEVLKRIGVTPEMATAPVLDPNGVQQFIVGSGGVGHYKFTSSLTLASDGSVATLARDHDDTFGVLKMTLGEGSYRWEMVAGANGPFRNADASTTGAFAGSEVCR